MLTRSHVNPIANTVWQLLRTAVLQDSVQGHLFCALPSSIRPDKWNLQSIKGYYSQKLPHLCEGRYIAVCVAGRAVLQQFLITFLLFSQLFARCQLRSLSVSFIVLQQIIRNHWKNYQTSKSTCNYWSSERWGRSMLGKNMAKEDRNINWLFFRLSSVCVLHENQ